MPRLKERYKKEIIPTMMKDFSLKNPLEVPKLEKIIVNMGIGEAAQNPKALDAAISDLTIITGQKPLITKAKKSIAGFKLRAGMSIGAKVTLRGDRMYEFLDRLLNIVLPRVRDFKGLSPRSFDGRGNYTIGLNEQLIFPEIEYDKVDKIRGMDVTIVTNALDDQKSHSLLTYLGLPFRKK
jgi:large subunit ribosomal protein L5